MATSHADIPPAGPSKQPRRSLNRIIPAVPHRFARPPATRPLTPEESTTVTQRDLDKQPAIKSARPDPAPAAIDTPLTPDSRVSPVEHRDDALVALASSPARSGDDHVEDVPIPATEANKQTTTAHTAEELAATPQPEPAISASNGNRPKSTVRSALPPEFHPREKPAKQTFIAETTEVASHPTSAHVPLHRPQVSVEGLVFGGIAQESPAMPSTPQDFDHSVRAMQQGFAPPPPPPPGLAPSHLAPQFYPGHSHHPSEPSASWPHPPYSMALPPDAIYANGKEFHSPAFPPASGGPFQHPFAAPFSPQGGPVSANGVGLRSHSQSPNKSQYGEGGPNSQVDEEPPNAMYTNGISSAQRNTSHDRHELSKHIFNQFGNPEFTDYILHIRSPDGILWSMPVHAAIVCRSPVIYEAFRHSAPPPFQTKDTRRLAEVITDDIFITPESLNEAVKILYAAPLLPAEAFLYNLSPYDADHDQGYASIEARKRMGQAISYTAAGRVLQIPEMQDCGLRIVKSLLRWDTLEIALHFGFSANKTTVQPNGFGNENRALDTYAVPLLDDTLEFIAYNFPPDFAFYSIASELRQTPRLPAVVESKQPSHNPRLSKIRFGDAPPEDEMKPSPVTQLLSSILLSVPLAVLDRLFSHPAAANQVGWSGLVRILRDVIEEREKRRQKVLKSMAKPLETSMSRSLLENLYREERVEPATERPSGFKPVAIRLSDQL